MTLLDLVIKGSCDLVDGEFLKVSKWGLLNHIFSESGWEEEFFGLLGNYFGLVGLGGSGYGCMEHYIGWMGVVRIIFWVGEGEYGWMELSVGGCTV